MVRTVRCSLSKIILGLALLTSSFLFIQFVLNILGEGHKQIVEKNLAANERNLKSAFSSNEVNINVGKKLKSWAIFKSIPEVRLMFKLSAKCITRPNVKLMFNPRCNLNSL